MLMMFVIIVALVYLGVSGFTLDDGSASIPDAPVAARMAPVEPLPEEAGALQRLTGAAASAVSSATGIRVLPLASSSQGCSPSVLDPRKVEELIQALPASQRESLSMILSASSSVWMAQLYRGQLGHGLCLPNQGKLVVF